MQQTNSYFIGHKTAETDGFAESNCGLIKDIFEEKSIPGGNLKAIGCDGTAVNTGKYGRVIRKLEVKWNRPLQWNICSLHFNELPLRALIKEIDGPTSRPKAFAGPVGNCLSSCGTKPIAKLDPIEFLLNMEDIFSVTNTFSTDQQYLFDICFAILNGSVSKSLADRAPGAMSHARWLTTANRILRLYVTWSNPDRVYSYM